MTRSRGLVAVAVLFAVLVTTAVPANAAANNVASFHTTNTDFQNADTLDNVTVTGSGTSADVSLSGTVVDDFEDSDINIETSGWSGWNGDTASFSAITGNPISGSASGQLEAFNAQKSVDAERTSDTERDVTAKIRINQTTGNSNDQTVLRVRDTNQLGAVADLEFRHNGSILWNSGQKIGTWTAGTEYTVAMDFDFTAGTVDIYLDGSYLSTKPMPTNQGQWDTFRLTTKTTNGATDVLATIDDVETIPENARGTYISQNHSAELIERGFVNLTLNNASATVEWQYHDGTQWVIQDQSTYTSDGNKTVSWPTQNTDTWRVNVTFDRTGGMDYEATLHDEGVQFEARAPTVNNSSMSPSGGTQLTQTDVPLEIDVNDSDFGTVQSDQVTVTYYTKAPSESTFTKEGTDTISSNGTASLTATLKEGGTWEWYAAVEDSYGVQGFDSQTETMTVPATLEIRNETPQHGKITTGTVELIFYEEDDDNPTIVNRTVTNGEVDLSGLPVGSKFSIHIEAPNHHTRTILLDSIYNQSTIYMLQTSTTSVEQTFDLQDSTGNFPGDGTDLKIQRAINDSVYSASGTGFNWTTVAGDSLSAAGTFTVDLETNTRYRIVVENEDGDVRILGTHTPTTDGAIVALKVGEVIADPEDSGDRYRYNASYTNNTASNNVVSFEYNDSQQETSEVSVVIFEHRNQSNVLFANTTFNGPLGSLAVTETVPSDQEDTAWVVKAVITRNGNQYIIREVVGPRNFIMTDMPNWLVVVISIGSIWMVAGLFSRLNGEVGALAVSGLAALYWYVGFLPEGVELGVVVLALIIAAVVFLNSRRSPAGGI